MANYFNMSVKGPDGRELNLFKQFEERTRCHVPFTHLSIKQNDKIGPCWYHAMKNPGWQNFAGYDIADFDKFWQSDKMKQFRQEIIKGNFDFCKTCHVHIRKDSRFVNDFLLVDMFGYYGKKIACAYKFNKDFDEEYPYTVELSFDLSCNVKCKTCRDEYITDYKIDENLIPRMIDYIKHCKNLVVGGDGELFCSKYYMQILAEDLSGCELKTITLMSNGLLFNEQNWNKIHPNNRKMINVVRISIDAATKETYEMLREGSKWDILQKNLAYLQQLKQEYGFELHSNFTISKWNYKEMVEFPNLMLKFGFDILLFSYADQEFRVGQDLHNKFTIDDKTFAECEELIKMLSADYVEKGLTII